MHLHRTYLPLVLLLLAGFVQAASAQITASLPSLSGNPGTTVDIPVTIANVPASALTGYSVTVEFSIDQVVVDDVRRAGTLSDAWSVTPNVGAGSVTVVATAGAAADITVGGTLFVLEATLQNPGVSPLTFDLSTLFEDSNGDEINSTYNDGQVTVLGTPNRAPTFTNTPQDQTIDLGQTFTFDYDATDPDGDPLAFGLTNAPAGASIDAQTGVLTFTPVAAGAYTLSVTVDDGSLSASTSVTVTVTQPNSVPQFTATLPNTTVQVGQAVTFTYRATDADGDLLTYGLTSPPAGATIDATTGAFSFTPPARGAYTITATVTDGKATTTTTATVTASGPSILTASLPVTTGTIGASVSLPVTVSGLSSGNADDRIEGYRVEFTYDSQVLDLTDVVFASTLSAAFTTAENLQPGHVIVTGTAGAAAPISADGTLFTLVFSLETAGRGDLDFVPGGTNFTNPQDLIFPTTLVDGGVTVQPPNALPVFTNALSNATGAEGAVFSFGYRATDADGDPLTFSLVQAPQGTSIDAQSGELIFIPGFDQAGTYQIAVRVEDAVGGVTTQGTLTVTNTNRAPAFTSVPADTVAAVAGQAFAFDFDATDADIATDADVLRFSLLSAPQGATIDAATGVFTYTPAAGASGVFGVEVRVADQRNAADTAAFALRVGTPAVLTSIVVSPDSVSLHAGERQAFTAAGFDQNGLPFSFTPTWSATGGTVTQAGVFTADGATGTYAVTARSADGSVVATAKVVIRSSVDAEAAHETPRAIALAQNYPNPFNPATTIRFSLPAATSVTLRVFDLLGQEVGVVLDGTLGPGQHEVGWDAGDRPSGVYLYRLEAGTSVLTRAMILTK